MPPSTRTRSTSTVRPAPTSSSSIKSFAKVVKISHASSCGLKENIVKSPCSTSQSPLGKRKRFLGEQVQEKAQQTPQITKTQIVVKDEDNSQFAPQTPQKTCISRSHLPSPDQTPMTKRSPSRFLPETTSTKEQDIEQMSSYNTPPTTPHRESLFSRKKEHGEENFLPTELCALLDLCGSFLKALTLHIAHHGVIAPIEILNLIEPTSRIWGVRKVTIGDIRRCLGILFSHMGEEQAKNTPAPSMELFDYGKGRICMEIEQNHNCPGGLGRAFNEEIFKTIFSNNLRIEWETWQSNEEREGNLNAESFILQLPMAKITLCPSFKKSKVSIAEGQQRLDGIKGLVKNARLTPNDNFSGNRSRRGDTKGRSDSLFERLKMKERQKATLPLPPTKLALDRKAALHRIPEIIQILSFSQATGQRTSLSLPAAIESIQNSAKSCLSKEEVENSIKLLAQEIGKGYVTLIETGSVVALVIDPIRKPEDIDTLIRQSLQV